MANSREGRAAAALPAFLYGTAWKEERTEALTMLALQAGFVGFDTANQRRHYFEAAVGSALARAIEAGNIVRERLFLQTKFTYARGQDSRLPYDPTAPLALQVAQSFQSSLEHLCTDYVDSYVLHGPSSASGLSREDHEVWRAMEGLVRSGKALALGVSNVSLEQLLRLYEFAEIKPAFVQNRCFARDGWDREVRAFARDHAMVYQGFSLLTANQRELSAPSLSRIRLETGRSLPELVFRFALQAGILPLTGTSQLEHMRLDLGCLEFELDPEHQRAIESVAG